MRTEIIKIIPLLALVIQLNCGGGKETIQIIYESNENTNNGNAVVVTVHQLTNADKFSLASFESLTKTPEATLGNDLVTNSILEKTVVPGKTFELKNIEIKTESAFIGIIADFHSPAPDGWQAVIPITEDLKRLVIFIHENSISIQKED